MLGMSRKEVTAAAGKDRRCSWRGAAAETASGRGAGAVAAVPGDNVGAAHGAARRQGRFLLPAREGAAQPPGVPPLHRLWLRLRRLAAAPLPPQIVLACRSGGVAAGGKGRAAVVRTAASLGGSRGGGWRLGKEQSAAADRSGAREQTRGGGGLRGGPARP
ncbi:hypothetical protein BRADI_4g27732v3 [Brachypodium distachyon]|uniref:Uncharacterized protein n=1 Tax=Brachypodium distachyon TaxID=15368 RepID=A0A0Q3LBD3_BRADI|nr:hypothetical protein BRADI_4g27732v3 [Brachypodium distachyon]